MRTHLADSSRARACARSRAADRLSTRESPGRDSGASRDCDGRAGPTWAIVGPCRGGRLPATGEDAPPTEVAPVSGGFGTVAVDYFGAHAIDPELATACGVREVEGELVFPYRTPNGAGFTRLRSLNGGSAKVKQPPERSLALWWPLRRPRGAEAVLVCEGESDALAALEPLSESRFASLELVALPGTGFPAKRLAARSARATPSWRSTPTRRDAATPRRRPALCARRASGRLWSSSRTRREASPEAAGHTSVPP